jgi:hypothetical protein
MSLKHAALFRRQYARAIMRASRSGLAALAFGFL